MKFAVYAVVVCALVAVAQCSLIQHQAISGPGGAIAVPGSVAVQASLTNGPIAAVAVQSVPHIIAAPAVAIASGEATYVAKTLGAVHAAPLPGHVQSAAAVNVQPAPGTA